MLRTPPWLLPTDRWTRAILAPALVFIATAIDRNYQTDLWHHLARGRAIVTEGQLLNADRFTYTVPGRPFQDVNWGWQVLFYQLYHVGGLSLVQVVNSVILAAMMTVLLGLCWRRSGSLLAASMIGVFSFFGLWQLLIIRPQTFSLLLFVLLYAVLEGSSRRPWLLAVPPVIMAVWVNVHGGFPIGLVLVGCYLLAAVMGAPEQSRPLWRRSLPWALCLLVSVAATLLNPYGWHVYEYVGVTSSSASGRRIDEWLPPGLDLLTGKLFVLSLLLMLVLFAFSGRRPTRKEMCLVCGFLPLACGSVRMVAWWLLISAPILAEQLVAFWPRLRQADADDRRPALGNAVACAAIGLAMILSLPWLEAYNPVLARPGRAHRTESDLQAVADRLTAEGGNGRIFTRFAWGEYLGWSLTPRFTVFMDGRIEIFPDTVWSQYSAITRGRSDWQDILDSYQVDHLLLDTTGYHHELLPLVDLSPVWRRLGQYGDAVLFVRQQPSSHQTAAR
jgi:hypothetical protein